MPPFVRMLFSKKEATFLRHAQLEVPPFHHFLGREMKALELALARVQAHYLTLFPHT
jgi:hypothetical protein